MECQTLKAKRDKVPKKNGSMFSYFPKKVDPIPSTVQVPPLILAMGTRSCLMPAAAQNLATIIVKTSAALALTGSSLTSTPPSPQHLRDPLNQLQIKPLAVFSGDPALYVGHEVKADELGEILGPLFHKAFGYGEGLEEMERMIDTGRYGLGGFGYGIFCPRTQISRGEVEVTIQQLLKAVKLILKKHNISDSDVAKVPKTPPQNLTTIIEIDSDYEIEALLYPCSFRAIPNYSESSPLRIPYPCFDRSGLPNEEFGLYGRT
ncbi:hypothetical protein FB451DRAFT_1533644 [Mycena latifolia]|nr:hypothetical protein FB451DRAFT_1533644 [Mycena latifolia]